jgi:hypothetical protein
VKHPVQRPDHHSDTNRIRILAAGAPAIERWQQDLFSPQHSRVVVISNHVAPGALICC